MKKIFTLFLFSALILAILSVAGCGKNKPGKETPSSGLFDTTQTESSSQGTGSSDFFESSDGTPESTGNGDNTPLAREN